MKRSVWMAASAAVALSVVPVGAAAAEAVRVKFSEADWISVYAASQGHEVP